MSKQLISVALSFIQASDLRHTKMTAEKLPLVGYYQFDDILWIRSYGIGPHNFAIYRRRKHFIKGVQIKNAFHLVVYAV